MLLYSGISNFTFWIVNILKCKNFLIGFFDELGNSKQKIFTFQNAIFFTFYSNWPYMVLPTLAYYEEFSACGLVVFMNWIWIHLQTCMFNIIVYSSDWQSMFVIVVFKSIQWIFGADEVPCLTSMDSNFNILAPQF